MLAELLLSASLQASVPTQVGGEGVLVTPSPAPLQDERDSFMVRSWAASVQPAVSWRTSCLGDAVEISARPGEGGWRWSLSRAGRSYPGEVAAVFEAEFQAETALPAVRSITCDPHAVGVMVHTIRPHRLTGLDQEDPERMRTVYEILETVIWIENGQASVRRRIHLGDEAVGPSDLGAE